MIKGLYTAAVGMLPRITRQEVSANNLANINTPGYKRDRVFLKALLKVEEGLSKALSGLQRRETEALYTDFSQGVLQQTHRTLDLAIEGDGFFVISTPRGERYTRNGSFSLGPGGLLVTSDGHPVLGEGGPVVLTGSQILINQRGEVIVDGEHVDRLLIMDFQHPYRLVKVGSGLFAPEDEMDAGEPAKEAKVRQGYLEGSNVRAIEEMVEMLLSYRRYEADHKAIQIQDETLGKAVNELGTVR